MNKKLSNLKETVSMQMLPVDTVKIILPKGNFKVKKLRNFKFNYVGLSRTATKQEKQHGDYGPKVTLSNLTGACTIEVSLPKLLKGNNLQELNCSDFKQIIRMLRVHLWSYGIAVSKENLRTADLYRVDFGKNIDLTSICSVADVLALLNRCIGFGRKATYQIQYQNGGRALRLQNASTDLLLYDKLYAYEMAGISEKLSIEKDHYCQKPLYEMLSCSNKSVLRIEQRYTTRRAIKRLFALYGILRHTFEDICNPKVGQDVITAEWKLLVKNCIFPMQSREKHLLAQIMEILKTGQCKTLRSVFTYVLLQYLLEEYAAKDLRKRFMPYASASTLDNLFGMVHTCAHASGVLPDILAEVTRQIMVWKPFEMTVDFSSREKL